MTKAQKRSESSSASETRTIRILIVDDHPVVRRGLAAMINQEPDLEVVAEAADFHQGLDAIRDQQPDLAIIDLTLEGIGGLELVKQVKSINPEMLMLVLSMHDETLYAERVLRAGARGYIMKQEGTDKLISAIRAIVRGDVYVSERMASRMLGKFVDGRRDGGSSPLERLSDRELEVFEMLGRGQSTREIADRLCVSIKTIESHREHIKAKLRLKNANELVQHATQWVVSEGPARSESPTPGQ